MFVSDLECCKEVIGFIPFFYLNYLSDSFLRIVGIDGVSEQGGLGPELEFVVQVIANTEADGGLWF